MIRALLALALLYAAPATADQAVSGDVLRLSPTLLPGTCNNGDVRTNILANYVLEYCSANTWAPMTPGFPSSTTLGGAFSLTPAAHQFVTGLSTLGVLSTAQPAYTDLSGPTTGTGSAVFNASPTFTGQLLAPDGSVMAPGYSFSNATTSGLYRIGTNDFGLSVNGVLGLEAVSSTSGFVNFGFGGPASTADSVPMFISRSNDSTDTAMQINNDSTAANSTAQLILATDGANVQGIMGAYTSSSTVPMYVSAFVVRTGASGHHLSLMGGQNAGDDVSILTNGDFTTAGYSFTFPADHSVEFMQAMATPSSPASGVLKAYQTTGNKFATVNSSGTVSSLSGVNTGDQTISLTGDVTGSGTASFATSVAKIQGTAVSGTTGSGNVVLSTSPTFSTSAILSGTSSGAITLAAGATPSTYTFTLPSSGGTNNYVLTTNGSGTTSWAPVTPSFSGFTQFAPIYAATTTTLGTVASAGTAGQVLTANTSAAPTMQTLPGNATALNHMTITKFTATGTTTGYLFTISTSTTCAVGDTYTNNSNTYTVIYALSGVSGQVFYMSGASAPTASGTLTRATGSGTASVTFSANLPLATYTPPSSPAPLYIKLRMYGGGGGGGGSFSTSGSAGTAGGTGGTSFFGLTLANGGAGTQTAGASGGTFIIASSATDIASRQGGSGTAGGSTATGFGAAGGFGASTPIGGGGAGGQPGAVGNAPVANTGAGGGGGGGPTGFNNQAGGGGGASAYIEAFIVSPVVATPYAIGTAGGAGTAGTSGSAGGAGSAGELIIEEHYQ